MRTNFFILFIAIAGLASCTQQSLIPVIRDAKSYQQQLSKLTQWQLEGKIAVRHANKSDSAAVQWQQHDEQFDIFLSGPLGAGATRLMGTPKSLIIANSDGQHTTRSDPQQLIEKHLGWTLPLEKLPRWIVGNSNNKSAKFNADSTLASFTEQDWQVEYQRYQTVDQWLLPEKLVLKHEDMQITIVIKRWFID